MAEFIHDTDAMDRPEKHSELVREMKMEALLATENSPYLEVRANVDPTDDPTMPALTFRVLVIGTCFSAAGSFIDTLFGYRNPAVYVGTNVGQLLAYPCAKAMEYLPKRKFRLFGYECSLNPGPFNKKEHMLITISKCLPCGTGFQADKIQWPTYLLLPLTPTISSLLKLYPCSSTRNGLESRATSS